MKFLVTDRPLDLQAVIAAVAGFDANEEQGGLVTFSGVVRRHSRGKAVVRLEYEAYVPMAERKLAEIGAAIVAARPGAAVAIHHRVGVLAVGELAVVIAASAPHRAPAFDACRLAIEELKRSVPIWKKEITVDGEAWIGLGP